MCLGVPGKVLKVHGTWAEVDFWGVTREVRLELCDAPVAPGDYILNHVGFAIRRIPAEDVAQTLALYDQLIEANNPDPLTDDLRDELQATEAKG